MARMFYKHVYRVEVLSEDEHPLEDLSAIDYATSEGDCSGKVTLESTEKIDAKQAALALLEQGSDPGFFELDQQGNDLSEPPPEPRQNDDLQVIKERLVCSNRMEFTESPEGYEARDKWARQYDELNGAPESDDDR